MKLLPTRNVGSASKRISPYYYTVKITCSHLEEQAAAQKMFAIYQEVQKELSGQSILLGPAPSAIMRVKNRYYYQLIIKYKNEPHLPELLTRLLEQKSDRSAKRTLCFH